jgi:hypothetical protein
MQNMIPVKQNKVNTQRSALKEMTLFEQQQGFVKITIIVSFCYKIKCFN